MPGSGGAESVPMGLRDCCVVLCAAFCVVVVVKVMLGWWGEGEESKEIDDGE